MSMAPNANKPKRRLGLTKDHLRPHLLQKLPPAPEGKVQRPEPAVGDPPLADSSEDELASGPRTKSAISSDLSDIDFSADDVGTMEEKRNHRAGLLGNRVAPSNIRQTVFTGRHDAGSKRSSQETEGEEDDVPWDDVSWSWSQSNGRKSQVYRKLNHNLHTLGASPKRKRAEEKVKKASAAATENGNHGFKVPHISPTVEKINKLNGEKQKDMFKNPGKLEALKNPPRRGTRKSPRSQGGLEDLPTAEFKLPPPVPPRLRSKNGEGASTFKFPLKLQNNEESSEASAAFKIPLPLHHAIYAAGLSEILDNGNTKFKNPMDNQTLLTTSSMPSLITDDKSSDSPLSSAPSSPVVIDSQQLEFLKSAELAYKPPILTVHCPVCKAVVDRDQLDEFTDRNASARHDFRLTFQQQAAFCRTHTNQSAQVLWRERGYPEIDWKLFPIRIEKQHGFIEDVMKGNTESFYRNALEDKIRSGKNRAAVQAFQKEGENVGREMGYYGGKGARIMMDHLITTFSRPLRRLATTDKLMSASGGGVSGFVQAVLVPELTVRLVMEDMKVDPEGARVIIRESADIGSLINVEEDDLVAYPEESQTEKKGYGE